MMLNSEAFRERGVSANQVRLDSVDRVILRELSADARIPNNVLARRAGVAPSTCLGRVRALREAGVVRGFHADIDLRSLGLSVMALISISVHPRARGDMLELARHLRDLPEALNVFVLAGDRDLLLHVAVTSADELREFVATHLGSNQAFLNTQTSLVFEHVQPGAPDTAAADSLT